MSHPPDIRSTNLNTRIRIYQAATRTPQVALGDAIGISQPQVSERLRGRLPWTRQQLERVAEAFGITYSELTSGLGLDQ